MKKIILILSFLTITVSAFAQNDIQLSQQINNRIVFNPAATGQSGCYNFTVLDREQWTGVKDAPSTQLFNFNKYFKTAKIGLGLTMIHDRLGVERSFNAKIAVAYHAWFTDEMVLSFGLGLGVLNKSLDGTELIYENPNDPNKMVTKVSKITPDFDFGLEYNWKSLSIGASATHLVTSLKKATSFKVPRHFYAYAKYAIKLSPSVEIVPALSWNNCGKVNMVEINAMANVKDRVSAGFSYRVGDAIVFIAGVKLVDAVRVSYSYDMKMGNIEYGSTKGSHEIMLLCRFGCNNLEKAPHPRFFN
ncbi:MAG TPA: type IX secretion system membrane protein PorP/SprF [Bacteroidales bacterium]|nr:type IX secretion system membrane protein PorP/SprF [Bacteroidales bacterium]